VARTPGRPYRPVAGHAYKLRPLSGQRPAHCRDEPEARPPRHALATPLRAAQDLTSSARSVAARSSCLASSSSLTGPSISRPGCADALRLADHRLRLCLHGATRDAPLGTPLGAPHMDTSSPNTHPSSQPTPNWMRAVPADQLPDQDRPRAWWGCCSWPVLRWQRSYPPNCARISSWQRAGSRRLGCSPGARVMGRLV
jgi:hypothetical protein